MLIPRSFKHCKTCGGAVRYEVPADDNRERAVCSVCHAIHYENPLNVVGTVPVWGEQVLLCRRAIEPRYGMWTLPAGFMELGETTADGALRETIEEAGARIEMQELFTVLNVVRVGQVHLYYRARMLGTDLAPGPETLEAALFDEADIRGNRWRSEPCAPPSSASSRIAARAASACIAPTSASGAGRRAPAAAPGRPQRFTGGRSVQAPSKASAARPIDSPSVGCGWIVLPMSTASAPISTARASSPIMSPACVPTIRRRRWRGSPR
jgi:ADP-ribose pyrophosphatase YjhB (NUDIX family)